MTECSFQASGPRKIVNEKWFFVKAIKMQSKGLTLRADL